MAKKQKTSSIPLKKPPQDEISSEEQWRLINESGLLAQKIPRASPSPNTGVGQQTPPEDFADEIFYAIMLIIPFTSLFLIMDIMIHQQYAQHPTFREEAIRIAKNLPLLSVSIFYTNRHKNNALLQAAMFGVSVASGIGMIYQINNAAWTTVMQQCPPLGTIWVYCIVQLHLIPAVASLAVVYGAIQYLGLRVLFQ